MGLLAKVFIFLFAVAGIISLFALGRNYLFDQKFQNLTTSFVPHEDSFQEVIPKKSFSSQDHALQVSYPLSWLEIPLPEQKNGHAKALFLAARFTLQGESAQLRVSEIQEEQLPFEKTIENMQEASKKDGWQMEILSSLEKGGELVFDARYLAPEGKEDLRSKEKILASSGKTYIVAVIASETEWGSFEKEAQYILDHTQLTVPSL